MDVTLEHGGIMIPHVDNAFAQWLYFIEHGHLPWNAGRPSEQWFSQVLESLAGNYNSAAAIRKLLADNTIAAERIVLHHSPEFLSHLVELLTAENQSTLPAAVRELAAWLHTINMRYSATTSLTPKAIERKAWIKILQKASTEQAKHCTSDIITFLIMRWLQFTRESLSALIRLQPLQQVLTHIEPVVAAILKGASDMELRGPENKHATPETPVSQDRKENTNAPLQEEAGKEQQARKEPTTELPEHTATQISSRLRKEKVSEDPLMQEQIIPGEGIYITHAGLILLHPFIHTLFKKLEYVKEGKFIDEAMQERAVCLLHELATGTPLQEYDLVIEKLLCAWPMHLPVDTSIELTNLEKEEAQNLLLAAIEQWPILRNTTPPALQETFLQRGGKLEFRNGKWYLQVEKIPVDILLSHLPWMISMIKLPWMKELLMVEWT